jgi:putative spermidine/putrescine transport system permease protein
MLRPPPYATPIERALFYLGWLFTGLVLLFLIAPILAIVPLSFNAEPYFS